MAFQTSSIVIVLLLALTGYSVMARSRYTPWNAKQDLQSVPIGEVDDSNETYQGNKKSSDIDSDLNERWLWLKELLLANEDNRGVRKNLHKEHVQKKSNSAWGEYMTPCHFKICNFGRKRNVFNL